MGRFFYAHYAGISGRNAISSASLVHTGEVPPKGAEGEGRTGDP
jgi:hypothetical protein